MKVCDWIGAKLAKAQANVDDVVAHFSVAPKSRKVMVATATIVYTTLYVSSARAEGLADIAESLSRQAERALPTFLRVAMVLGVLFVIYGIMNMYKRSQPGGAQVDVKSIWIPILAGALMGGAGWFFNKSGETMGMQPGSYGQLPN